MTVVIDHCEVYALYLCSLWGKKLLFVVGVVDPWMVAPHIAGHHLQKLLEDKHEGQQLLTGS